MPISRGRVFFYVRISHIPPRAIGAHISLPAPRTPKPHRAAFRALCAHISRRMAYLPARANTRPHIASIDPARMTITKQSIIPTPITTI